MVRNLCAQGLALEETHISWVFLGEKEVWKIKKPVVFDFLDYSTLEKRRLACEAEVILNRRLAPAVYRGVVPVTRDDSGRHSLGGKGSVDDWAVHMIRLPDADRVDRRLASGRLEKFHLRGLAESLAEFHRTARCDGWVSQFGSREAVARNIQENLQESRKAMIRILGSSQTAEFHERQNGFLREHSGWFEKRERIGKIREGHGDLRLGQIYFDSVGACSILDCVEFSERLRYGDVCADAAFLSMDLAAHGRRDLGEFFLAEYARFSGDYDLYRLVDFYENYRACIRGKVACLLAGDAAVPDAQREKAESEARNYFQLAAAFRPAPPLRFFAVGGPPASGKSTLASRLGDEWRAPVISSDWTRKQMAGLKPMDSEVGEAWKGIYEPENTKRVYDEILRRARIVVESGRPIVVDATFRSAAQRVACRRMASELGAKFTYIECRSDPETCRTRLRNRNGKSDVSDARETLLDDFLRQWEPVVELVPVLEHLVVDTTLPLDRTWAELKGRLV